MGDLPRFKPVSDSGIFEICSSLIPEEATQLKQIRLKFRKAVAPRDEIEEEWTDQIATDTFYIRKWRLIVAELTPEVAKLTMQIDREYRSDTLVIAREQEFSVLASRLRLAELMLSSMAKRRDASLKEIDRRRAHLAKLLKQTIKATEEHVSRGTTDQGNDDRQ
jgi:hypothetical protein